MVRSAGDARAFRTMAASAALLGPASFETTGQGRSPQDEGVSAQPIKITVLRYYASTGK
jgi:hypothetical protein